MSTRQNQNQPKPAPDRAKLFVDAFLVWMEVQKGASPATLKAYGSDLAQLAEFLVREHLLMSQVAQKQDLSDPDVIRAFAQHVGNERQLTALYLLTVADIRGTSPKVWNAWKGKLLEDLYRATLRVLGGRAPDAQAMIEARKASSSAAPICFSLFLCVTLIQNSPRSPIPSKRSARRRAGRLRGYSFRTVPPC